MKEPVARPEGGEKGVGEGVKVGAGSVVLSDAPPHTTIVGVPAEVIGVVEGSPAAEMNQRV